MSLKNTLLSNYTRRLNSLPPERLAAINDALQQQRHVVMTFDPTSVTSIATLTGDPAERLWHEPMTTDEVQAVGDALVTLLNEQDADFQAAVGALLETGGRLMLGMKASILAPELVVMLYVDGQLKPLGRWIDAVTTIH